MEWKLEISTLGPDIEVQNQPLEEIERENSDSDGNVEISNSDENVGNTVEHHIEEKDFNARSSSQWQRNKPKRYRGE